jgi:carboxyl-terminal processing protease
LRRFKLPHIRHQALFIVISLGVIVLLAASSLISAVATPSQGAIFEEVWQAVQDNFYDPKLRGVDWQALKDKYQSPAIHAGSREESAGVINQMLDELQSSHTRFYTASEPAYYQLLGIFKSLGDFAPDTPAGKRLSKSLPNQKLAYSGIGVYTRTIHQQAFVNAILDGSPAAEAGLKVGDQILGVDGQPYHPIQSFQGKAGRNVSLEIQRSPDPNSKTELRVKPRMIEPTTMFLDAQRASTEVIHRNGKKFGYVHIWALAGEPCQQQALRDSLFSHFRDADGLILDLRDGWGGILWPGFLNRFSGEGPNVTFAARNGQETTNYGQWQKPVAVIINEGTRSGKELLSFGFQQYHLGTVIGARTAGAVLGSRPFVMQDGSLLILAVTDVSIDGQRLEGVGVTPSIPVPFTLEYAQGADPLKAKAVETVLAAVKS